jgi:hypothetical protein
MMPSISSELRCAVGTAALAVAIATPSRAEAQYTTTTRASCVGGAIGCTQMDFFIEFLNLLAPTEINAFGVFLSNPAYLFATPGTTEAEDALGFNFYTPVVSNGGLTLSGDFVFAAFLDPAISSTIRVRAEMAAIPPTITDASDVAYAYTATQNGTRVASGRYDPAPVTATPEPATLTTLGTGLAAIGGWARRRKHASQLATTA